MVGVVIGSLVRSICKLVKIAGLEHKIKGITAPCYLLGRRCMSFANEPGP
jgi:hypothetical protein